MAVGFGGIQPPMKRYWPPHSGRASSLAQVEPRSACCSPLLYSAWVFFSFAHTSQFDPFLLCIFLDARAGTTFPSPANGDRTGQQRYIWLSHPSPPPSQPYRTRSISCFPCYRMMLPFASFKHASISDRSPRIRARSRPHPLDGAFPICMRGLSRGRCVLGRVSFSWGRFSS